MRRLSLLAVAALAMCGCGYPGDPQPPLANIPAPVQGLSAVQRGARIIVQFPLPPRTTENMLIQDPLTLDLRIGTFPGADFDVEQWAAQARRIPPGAVSGAVARYEVPAAEWTGKEAIVAARTALPDRKPSAWSNYAIVEVVPPPETPRDLRAAATPDGVRLTWNAAGASFRVFRRADAETAFTAVANVDRPEWVDSAADFGKHYVYAAQTIVKLANNKEAESELSAEAAITPEEVFPPAAPKGLQAAAAANSIELAWDANAESFLSGYRVYRSVAGGPFEKIADIGQLPAYSDRNPPRGRPCRYEVTAVSRTGYESPRSAGAEATLP